jgi:hypothetical protein
MTSTDTPGGGSRAAITVCVIVATLMQALDTTIANVALPYMQGSSKGRGQMRALAGVRPTARAKREIIAVCCARAAGRKQAASLSGQRR